MNYTKVKEVKTKVEGYITADEIRSAFDLPENARVYFQVPGGGDWCNADINITREDPVYVTFTYTKYE